jgi:hypothetical protein
MRTPNTVVPLTFGQQDRRIRQLFPQFVSSRKGWRGELQPLPETPVYRVDVVFKQPARRGGWPQVAVYLLHPRPDKRPPHTYAKDWQLCLYHPQSFEAWKPTQFIAESVLMWTVAWLLFYHFYCITGVWQGPEADHGPGPKRAS